MSMKRTWLERVTAPVITEGHIRQFRLAVWPMSFGFLPSGAKTNMTEADALEIVETFTDRVRNVDGGPKVTNEQADKGTRWLHSTGKRYGIPERFQREWPLFYRFEGCHLIWEDHSWNHAWYAPIYVAHYADGTTLRYAPGSWMSGKRDTLDFTVTEAA